MHIEVLFIKATDKPQDEFVKTRNSDNSQSLRQKSATFACLNNPGN